MTIKELRKMTRRQQIGVLSESIETKNPMLTRKEVSETNAQRSERLNMLRRFS